MEKINQKLLELLVHYPTAQIFITGAEDDFYTDDGSRAIMPSNYCTLNQYIETDAGYHFYINRYDIDDREDTIREVLYSAGLITLDTSDAEVCEIYEGLDWKYGIVIHGE